MDNWENVLEGNNRILLVDENATFLQLNRFSSMLKASDNYIVIVSRYDYPSIPYAIGKIQSHKLEKEVNNV